MSVVTIVPGSGDEVQALKAGIMEIADIFVVNKADREGADRTVASIEANLSLQTFAAGRVAAADSPDRGDNGSWRSRTAARRSSGFVRTPRRRRGRGAVREPSIDSVRFWPGASLTTSSAASLAPVSSIAFSIASPPGDRSLHGGRRHHEESDMKATLDHIGIAVADLDAALGFYRDALGLEVEAPEDVPSQRVRAHFIPVGESALELLEATDDSSPIAKYVARRGPGLHHITLRVDDIAGGTCEAESRVECD